MSDTTIDSRPEFDELPIRPRRRLIAPVTVMLLALLVGAGGFLAGVEVEKGQTTSATAGGGGGGGFAALRRAAAAAPAGGGRGGGGGGATIGQVSTISASTLYVTDIQGDTIKVTGDSAAVTRTATSAITAHQIHPGDAVVVTGTKQPDGSVTATTVRDSSGAGAGAGGLGALFGGGSAGGGGGGGRTGGGGQPLFGGGG